MSEVMTTESAPPAGSKGDRTRRRLLEIAVRRFAADGYRRTSVSEIAREAGLTPAATYAYFANKEALFQAAVDADAGALIETARASSTGGTMQERWIGMLAVLQSILDDFPLARRVLAGQEPEAIERLLDLPSLAAARADLTADLRDAQARGNVRADIDAELVAAGIETLTLTVLMASVQTDPQSVADRAPGVIAVYDAALRDPSAPPLQGLPDLRARRR